MQLMANGIVYYNKAYDDMKYQIDAFTDCFTQGMLHFFLFSPFVLLLFSPLYFDSNKCAAKMSHSTHMEAFFSCYNDSRLQEHVIGSHPYVMDSVYVYQVHNWLKYFPTEQILFINSNDIFASLLLVLPLLSFTLVHSPFFFFQFYFDIN